MTRLLRASRRLTCAALILCIPLWLAGHFWSVGLAIHNTSTLADVTLTVGRGIGLRRSAGNTRLGLQPARGTTATLTLCDRDAAILAHARFGVGPFDPTAVHLPNLSLPFWALIPALASILFLIRARERRLARRTNHCPACDYDLKGLAPNSPCPECGKLA